MTIRATFNQYLFSVPHGTDGGDHAALRYTHMFRYWVQILGIIAHTL